MNISDLCAGAIAFPTISVLNSKRNILQSCKLDKVATCITLIFGVFSFLILSCISVDRYLQVTKLNRYNLYMNEFRMKIMICSNFAVSAIIAILSTIYASFLQQVITVSASFFVTVFDIAIYIFLTKRLRNHAKSQGNNTSSEHSSEPPGNRNNQLSAVITIQVLLIFLTITYTPYHIMSCWWAYYKFLKKVEPGFYISIIYAWSSFLALSNSCGNSWIIIAGNGKSRRFLLSLFRRSLHVVNIVENWL